MGKTAFGPTSPPMLGHPRRASRWRSSPLEMGEEQLVTRLLSSEALIQSGSLRTGNLKPDDWSQIGHERPGCLPRRPSTSTTPPASLVAEMKAKLRRFRDLGLVVIDYLQLMSTGKRSETGSGGLGDHPLFKDHGQGAQRAGHHLPSCPAALSPGPTTGPCSPTCGNPGSIEQDADIVMFLYREAYYNPECEGKNTAECIVAKTATARPTR